MKSVLTIAGAGALGALMLSAAPALSQSYYGGGYGAGYDYNRGAYAYGNAYAGQNQSYGYDQRDSYGRRYGDRGYDDRARGDHRDQRRHERYDPPQRPAPYTTYNSYGVNSAHLTGYSHGYGGVGYPYARTRSYSYTYSQPTHGYRQYGYDRGGRYGYSRSYSHDQRQPGYRDRHGYHDDRPPIRHRAEYRYDNDYRYDRDCYCQDVYLYDR
ncbi:MAG: hypothetical protein ACK4FB_07200 [Brevundimonas sp.]|uniref:hypothetical protein n=1 Tax=Brevundimonas sp. TaxID=1871086 RepID=UPI00391B8D23